MGFNYTEQDTERARQADQSSAGLSTQQLAGAPAPALVLAGRNNIAALAMIGIGLLLLMGRFFPDHTALMAGLILLTIASCFLFFSFWRRIYGLMIPGALLLGLSVGIPFVDLTQGVSLLWGLALAFFGIFAVGRVLFHRAHPWPVIPAVILFAVGLIVAAAHMPGFFVGSLVWMPLLLIGAGLYLGWGRARAKP